MDFDHPSGLCNKLAAGKLDVALVSSVEFLRNPIYQIVDDVSISSDGPVYSVVLAYRGEITDIEEIELDPASQTSGKLLRCLMAERGLSPWFVEHDTSSRAPAESKTGARLLIGDQAIRLRQESANQFSFWDLGEQWQKLIQLPFVYAFWLVRPEVADPNQVATHLRNLRDENFARLDHVIKDTVASDDGHGERKEIDREFLSRYYRDYLRFGFGKREKDGLRIFADLCVKHGLLPKRDLAFRVV